MNSDTKEAPTVSAPADAGGLAMLLPAHLTDNFEKANRWIQETYAMNPGVPSLVRLWLACSTSSQIRKEFELAVLDVTKPGIKPHENGEFDDDCLL